MIVKATNIVWDTDGAVIAGLPTEAVFELEDDAHMQYESSIALSNHHGCNVWAMNVEEVNENC